MEVGGSFMNLFISDLDGTLLNKDGLVSEETSIIINDLIAKGVKFSIATARSLEGAIDILAPLNLELPIVLFNGVEVYCPVKKEVINYNYLSSQDTFFITDILEKNNVYPFVFTRNEDKSGSAYYKGQMNGGQKAYKNNTYKNRNYFKSISEYKLLDKKSIISVAALDKQEKLEKLYEKMKDTKGIQVHLTEDIYIPGYYWLEFGQEGSSKEMGVKFLKDYTKAKKLIAFGDNINDISMFQIADEKYAVGNAREELKSIATDIIEKNIDNGVANFIKRYYEKEKS